MQTGPSFLVRTVFDGFQFMQTWVMICSWPVFFHMKAAVWVTFFSDLGKVLAKAKKTNQFSNGLIMEYIDSKNDNFSNEAKTVQRI